jgi:RNA-directed DNA polymerase
MSLIHELVVHFRVSPSDLLRIISTAPARYKQYTIPKRRGGIRVIAQPSRELKALQRYILDYKLSTLPIHAAATGYVKGQNILQNAAYHQNNRIILKLDFVDFFPSIKVRDWDLLLRILKTPIIQRDESSFYKNILFWGQGSRTPRCLAIGAPSSPTLSNIMMFRLDTRLAKLAERFNAVYTRYADDITVSGKRVEDILRFEASFQRIIKETKSPLLTTHDEKRGIYLKGQRRMVTGLIITPNSEISIGRERKRLISVMLHKVLIGTLDAAQMGYLKGMCGFCLGNEPSFISRMRRKYGNDVVDRVLSEIKSLYLVDR